MPDREGPLLVLMGRRTVAEPAKKGRVIRPSKSIVELADPVRLDAL